MTDLNRRWKTVQKQLDRLSVQARRARGQARKRLKRLERRTRVTVARALRTAEPQVRDAMAEAARVARGLRAGVKAGAAAYKASSRHK
jgi:hypothetical protein